MNKILLSFFLLAMAIGVKAQQEGHKGNSDHRKGPKGQHKMMTPGERADRTTQRLDSVLALTPEQEKKVHELAVQRNEQFKQIHEKYKSSENRKEMHDAMKPVQDKFHSDLEAVLTPEQKAKYAEYRKNKKAQMEKRKQQMHSGQPSGSGEEDMEPED
jgi:hypothetical protein